MNLILQQQKQARTKHLAQKIQYFYFLTKHLVKQKLQVHQLQEEKIRQLMQKVLIGKLKA